jgi:DNA-binding transcriptional LysR family regulator
MHLPYNFDLSLLRTLIAIAEEGNLSRAAIRVGRTQSAISLQVRRLESSCGCDLLYRRKGIGVDLTEAGKNLVEQSRELLALNDKIFGDLGRTPNERQVRLGAWEGYSTIYIAPALDEFGKYSPRIKVEVASGLSCQLLPLLLDNKVDLMLCDSGMEPPRWPAIDLWATKLRWITAERDGAHRRNPLPISLGPQECPWRPPWVAGCLWREHALRALDSAKRAYVLTPSITTIAGQDSAVLAGNAVTVSTLHVLPAGLRHVQPDDGLPELPDFRVLLLKAARPRQPSTDILADFLAKVLTAKRLQA